MATASLTSKGQITVPVEVRRKLRLKPGDQVSFEEKPNGVFEFRAKRRSIMDICGAGKWDGPPVTIEEMNETIEKGWAGLLEDDE
jgi:AbrB family looped-hinge helix DNA binding protein